MKYCSEVQTDFQEEACSEILSESYRPKARVIKSSHMFLLGYDIVAKTYYLYICGILGVQFLYFSFGFLSGNPKNHLI